MNIDKLDVKIFTTGAILEPIKYIDNHGNSIIVWQVLEFVDDNYNEEGNLCNPVVQSEKEDDIFKITDEEID